MADIAIHVENLWKRYHIGAASNRADTLREWIVGIGKRRRHDRRDEAIWALRQLNLQVQRGEVMGVIGRNGSGKTTLLKILSRITEPTRGRAELDGRTGSLLEVGTGFHPELTGRENVYLSGAILGMNKREIDQRFDEIVSFAGVERFLDTPIKRYSSGMNVRLGFAVAAHLEPEILLIDEVLAVGDASFRRRSLAKMRELAGSGRTVLFVAHDMSAVRSLCDRALLLENGQEALCGPTDQVIERYLGNVRSASRRTLAERDDRSGDGSVRLTALEFKNSSNVTVDTVSSGDPLQINLDYEASQPVIEDLRLIVGFFDSFGRFLFTCDSNEVGYDFGRLGGSGTAQCRVERLPLPPGNYVVNLYCQIGVNVADHIVGAARLTVSSGDFYGSGNPPSNTRGGFLVDHAWEANPRIAEQLRR